ncbi:hypothetical protein FHX15_003277 [Rhizobium sp. BK650]|nr:hypothetical protein [Rhizobium sp. BK650]
MTLALSRSAGPLSRGAVSISAVCVEFAVEFRKQSRRRPDDRLCDTGLLGEAPQAYEDTSGKVVKKLRHLSVHLIGIGSADTGTYERHNTRDRAAGGAA